jgi:protein-S-isoprenylcysteine O-methyltransferase Ste14
VSVIAWLGALAFAGSLLYLAYFYAVILGRPGAAGGSVLADSAINITIFGAFALHHSLFARAGVKRRVHQLIDPRLERSLYVWVASALSIVVCAAWRPLGGVAYEAHGATRVLLYGLQLTGLLLAANGAGVIDALELAGVRQVVSREPVARLEVVGPFRLVRHPIYLGWMVMVFGAPTMTADRLLFAIMTSAYLILAIPWEERSLAAAHGDRYRAYQQQVRWRLVPGLW